MISDKAETRELFTLDADGVLLRGTCHHVPDNVAASGPEKKIGIVFLNPLSTPRALIGDSAVFWANSFAAQGYPCFRIDLPGLGDSYGVLPNDLVTFINDGGFGAITASKMKELVHRFGLSGVVFYGHCSAANTAIYAALECKECLGVVTTDPYFNAANPLTPKLSPAMVNWARRTKVGELLRAAYSRVREARKKFRNGPLPGNAHLGLVTAWKKVASSGLPILFFKSHEPAALGSARLRSGSLDYIGYIGKYASRTGQITIRVIEDTNHSFADRAGKAIVHQHVSNWLAQCFPQGAAETVVQEQAIPVQKRDSNEMFIALETRVSPGD